MRYLIESDKAILVSRLDEHCCATGSSMFGPIVNMENLGERLGSLAEREIKRREAAAAERNIVAWRDGTLEDEEPSGPAEKKPNRWKLNKKMLFRRAVAYASLAESFRFLAFYTVSFPEGMPESVVCRIWNKGLTRLRRDCGLKSYVWVAERQSNGTRHYHMLTNNWMSVRDVNNIFAVAIDGEVKAGNCFWGRSSLSLYNGVDVERVKPKAGTGKNGPTSSVIRQVIRYLTKYIAKGSGESEFRLWHCSRNVSALVVRASVEAVDFEYAVEEAERSGSRVKVWECEYANVVLCDFSGTDVFAYYVGRVNNIIWDYLKRRGMA